MPEATEETTAPDAGAPRVRRTVDVWFNVAVGVLVVAVLGFVGWFGYTVYQDRKAAEMTNAPTRVIQALEAQVRKSPNDVVLRVRLGEALGSARKYPDAVEQLNQALRIDAKHVGAHLDLGLIALLTKNETEAERYLKKVIELTDSAQYSAIDERRESALYNLGLLKIQQKQYEEAAGYFKGALRIRKDASDTYLALAQALEGMDDDDAAIENLMVAIQFDPGFAEAHYMLGQLYQKKKDDVNASYYFYQAFKNAPDAPETQDAIASFGPASDWIARAKKSKASDLEAALEQALVARNLDPKNLEAARVHAEILVQRENFSDAIDVYLQAQELAPKDKAVAAALATLVAEHPAEALAAYEKRLKAKPTDKELKAKVAELKKSVKAQ